MEINKWMNNNSLQLNSNKTEALLIGTPHQVHSSPISQLTFDGQIIPLSSSATNLGVRLDSHLTFNDHIKHLYKNLILPSPQHFKTPFHSIPPSSRTTGPCLHFLKTGLL